MTIKTIKTRVIIMTQAEHAAFMRALEQAKEGRTVHSRSVEMEDGSQLCVCVESREDEDVRKMKERQARAERMDKRFN